MVAHFSTGILAQFSISIYTNRRIFCVKWHTGGKIRPYFYGYQMSSTLILLMFAQNAPLQ
jgi:hypothetical protein